jgi:hypothetical protein
MSLPPLHSILDSNLSKIINLTTKKGPENSKEKALLSINKQILTLSNELSQNIFETIVIPFILHQQSTTKFLPSDDEEISQKQTLSSYQIGKEGEEELKSLIESVFNTYEVEVTGKIPHAGDIHATNHSKNILIMFESKKKQATTKLDIDKFNSNLENLKSSTKIVFGIFCNQSQSNIPSIGSLLIKPNKIFLSKDYINRPTFEIIKQNIEIMSTILSTTQQQQQLFTTTFSPEILQFIANLKAQIPNMDKERALLNSTIESAKTIISNSEQSLIKINLINSYIQMLKDTVIPSDKQQQQQQIEDQITKQNEKDLINYLNQPQHSKIKKKELVQHFPFIYNLTLQQILEKYGPNDSQ